MTNQLELKIYELETALADYKARIVLLEDRIEYLEKRPNLYQRKDTAGQPTGMVYVKGQNKKHNDTVETR